MATLKQRLHRKNTGGTYDIVHLETSASCVLMANGTTVEAAVNGKAASSHTHNYAASTHNHSKSQITDFPSSLPASDVYSWAKASSKPSYAWSEITGKPSSFTPATHTHSEYAAVSHTHSYAASSHNHDASNITSGTLAVARGGTGVTSLDALASALGGAKIAYGSYQGNYNYGNMSNACKLTFTFKPAFVWVFKGFASSSSAWRVEPYMDDTSESSHGMICIPVIAFNSSYSVNFASWSSASSEYITFSWNESTKTLSWYASTSETQFNNSPGSDKTAYYYIAIG